VEPQWPLDQEKDGIEVYTRPVAGSKIKEFKGFTGVDSGIDNILALLRDSNRFKTWFPNTSESKLLARKGDMSYPYFVMAKRWPMADRDMKTNGAFTMHLEPGGGIPQWMINLRIVAPPFEALTNLQTTVASSGAN